MFGYVGRSMARAASADRRSNRTDRRRRTAPKRDERTAVDIVSQSLQPTTALIEFIAGSLEGAGFVLRTDEWPLLYVQLDDWSCPVRAGVGAPNIRRFRRLLAQFEHLVDDIEGR